VITIQIIDHTTGRSAIAEIPSMQAPALRSALQEVRDELADRISARYVYEREAPYTRAITALGTFAAAFNKLVPKGDPDFGPRSQLWPDEDVLHAEGKQPA
jgi:hypothetical protein